MAKKDLIDALDDPSAQIRKSGGELNKIFWKTIAHYNIGVRQMYDGLRAFVNDPVNCEQTTNRRTEMRNNIITRITKSNLTWFYLMRALRAIEITRIELDIRCYRRNDKRPVAFSHNIDLHPVTPNTDGEGSDETTDDEADGV